MLGSGLSYAGLETPFVVTGLVEALFFEQSDASEQLVEDTQGVKIAAGVGALCMVACLYVVTVGLLAERQRTTSLTSSRTEVPDMPRYSLETIIIVLLLLWLLGAFITPFGGGLIHVLLVIILVVVVIRLLQGRNVL